MPLFNNHRDTESSELNPLCSQKAKRKKYKYFFKERVHREKEMFQFLPFNFNKLLCALCGLLVVFGC